MRMRQIISLAMFLIDSPSRCRCFSLESSGDALVAGSARGALAAEVSFAKNGPRKFRVRG